MNPNEYQDLTKETEIYTEASEKFIDEIAHAESWDSGVRILSTMYCAGKLNGEAGEVAEIVFKAFRGGAFEPEKLQGLFKELGDIMWYVARLADIFGWKLEDVMQANIDKLMDRKERGVLHGYGDER